MPPSSGLDIAPAPCTTVDNGPPFCLVRLSLLPPSSSHSPPFYVENFALFSCFAKNIAPHSDSAENVVRFMEKIEGINHAFLLVELDRRLYVYD